VKFSLRDVTLKDEKLLLDWRNDLEARRWSFKKKSILLSEHRKFFKKKISKKNYFMWIFLFNNKPSGLVRISIEGNKAILSYLISKDYRGKKLSSIMLKLAVKKICKKFPKIIIFALTKSENKVSIKSLLRAGFVINGMEKNKKIYMRKCV
jgi:RimJ/RimL family protein N-acetyltransferase